MPDAVGVNPIEAMNEAEQAEELAFRTTTSAPEFETIMEDLKLAVSSFVVSGLTSLGIKTFENISRLAQNSVNLAEDIQGADLEMVANDHENSEGFREGAELLDIQINF